MAHILHYARLVPMAIRVTLAGGATYGTVKAGAWSDSGKSQEKLEQLQQSLDGIREIEYPTASQGSTSAKNLPSSAPPPGPTPSWREELALSWNSAVKTVCRSATSQEQLSASSESHSSSSHSSSEVQKTVRDSRHSSEK